MFYRSCRASRSSRRPFAYHLRGPSGAAIAEKLANRPQCAAPDCACFNKTKNYAALQHQRTPRCMSDVGCESILALRGRREEKKNHYLERTRRWRRNFCAANTTHALISRVGFEMNKPHAGDKQRTRITTQNKKTEKQQAAREWNLTCLIN